MNNQACVHLAHCGAAHAALAFSSPCKAERLCMVSAAPEVFPGAPHEQSSQKGENRLAKKMDCIENTQYMFVLLVIHAIYAVLYLGLHASVLP